eukprot:jgi/Phyca11/533596/estExt2_fgenesh1_pg.C_PHYCAscaffold_150083
MEDEDFVADSDEDEQEMVDAQALEEERVTRQRLEEAAAVNLRQVSGSQSQKEQEEEKNAAIVSPEQCQIAHEEEDEDSDIEEDELSEEEEARDEQEKEEEQVEEDGILAVGTLVESGFDRHVEREFVQSSALMKQQSDRKPVGREYYHDDYINKPHEKKQRELEKKHEQTRNHLEQVPERGPHRKKRKRSHQTHSEQVHKMQLDTEVDIKKRPPKMSKLDEDIFHEEQTVVNQQLQNFKQMPSADLHALRRKMHELHLYVKKKLVNAGEDAMNKVIQEIHEKRGRPNSKLGRGWTS